MHMRRLKLDKKYRKRQVTLRGRNEPAKMMVESGYPGVSGIREPSINLKIEETAQTEPSRTVTSPSEKEGNSIGSILEEGSEVKIEEEGVWTGQMDRELA